MKIYTENDCGELLKRGFEERERELEIVKNILSDVRTRGDAAVFDYEKQFSGALIDQENICVGESRSEERRVGKECP